eukprot:365636-Amphidinium_carterae.1
MHATVPTGCQNRNGQSAANELTITLLDYMNTEHPAEQLGLSLDSAWARIAISGVSCALLCFEERCNFGRGHPRVFLTWDSGSFQTIWQIDK